MRPIGRVPAVDRSALLGGFIGAGITAALAFVGLRRQRQSTDAEAFGPALLLLDRLNPDRVAMNLGNAEAETAKWLELRQQSDAAQQQLLVVAAGHPRSGVRRRAAEARVKLANAFSASEWQVGNMLRNQDNREWMEHARRTHAEATTAMRELVDANFAWSPVSRRW
jgi:hypothetical protein